MTYYFIGFHQSEAPEAFWYRDLEACQQDFKGAQPKSRIFKITIEETNDFQNR
jgi:hypothetical protein